MSAQRHTLDPEENELPEGTVYCGPQTPYGNPWEDVKINGKQAVQHRQWRALIMRDLGDSVDVFKRWVLGNLPINDDVLRIEVARPALHIRKQLPYLKGRDLGCQCLPGQKCHADVLIELTQTVK